MYLLVPTRAMDNNNISRWKHQPGSVELPEAQSGPWDTQMSFCWYLIFFQQIHRGQTSFKSDWSGSWPEWQLWQRFSRHKAEDRVRRRSRRSSGHQRRLRQKFRKRVRRKVRIVPDSDGPDEAPTSSRRSCLESRRVCGSQSTVRKRNFEQRDGLGRVVQPLRYHQVRLFRGCILIAKKLSI